MRRVPIDRLITSPKARLADVSIALLCRVAAKFLPAAAALTMAAGLTFLAVQQDLRIGANDVPQQLAEDGVAALNVGAAPATVVGSDPVPIESSLAPFVVVFDGQGTLLASNGSLDGKPPAPPAGVLRAAEASGRDAVTWQPRAGVRIALVALPWKGGTVVAGRSLRIIESRIDAIQVLMGAGLLAGLAVLAVVAAVAAWLWSGSEPEAGDHAR